MENPQDVTKCFGCRHDQETYTYVQTKTGTSISYDTHGNREVKASQVVPRSRPNIICQIKQT